MVLPITSGGGRITGNYKKLNQIGSLNQLSISRVDQIQVISLLALVSSFHQTTAYKDTVPLVKVFTPAGLYKWLVLPQSSRASPEPVRQGDRRGIKGLKQVATYLDDVIVFDSDPTARVKTIRDPVRAAAQA